MGRSKTTTWVIGFAFVAILALVASWFLLISPVFAKTAETRTEVESVQASNDQLRNRIAVLKKQYANIDQYEAQLAELRQYVPTTAQLSEYLRTLNDKAAAHSVTLTTISPSDPEAFSPYQAPAPAATASPEPSASASSSPSASPTADASGGTETSSDSQDTGSVVPDGMADIQLQIGAVGTYDNIVAFLDALQNEPGRLLLINQVTGQGLEDADAGGGRPATTLGDLEVTIYGFLYVLPDDSTAPAGEPEATPAPLPPAAPGKNPLIPFG